MKIYQEIQRETFWPYKHYGALVTSEGSAEKLKEILKDINPSEFEQHGTDSNGKLVLPIYDELEEVAPGYFISKRDVSSYPKGYFGNFEIDIEKLYQKCAEEKIPILVLSSETS